MKDDETSNSTSTREAVSLSHERSKVAMRRIIPFLLLAFVAVACERDGPTVPVDGPQFAKGKPDKPPGKPGDEDYVATILQTFGTSVAADLSDDLDGGTVLVVGSSKEKLGTYYAAATWTVSGSGDVDGPNTLPLDNTGLAEVYGVNVQARAYHVSDDGRFIAGYAMGIGPPANAVLPVRWNEGVDEPLAPAEGHPMGVLSGVNDNAQVVGWSYGAVGDVPTRWDEFGTATVLPSPLGGDGNARRINNQGYVVGDSRDPLGVSSHAIVWTPDGSYCDLSNGSSGSYGVQITDVQDGKVLVAGDSGSPEEYQAAVWEVQVTETSCYVVRQWTMGGLNSTAFDVRRVGSGWEAVGIDVSGPRDQPMVWRWDGMGMETTETLVAKEGRATGVNSDGRIVGKAEVKKSDQAMLWTTKSNL
jgi:hypothetical protein